LLSHLNGAQILGSERGEGESFSFLGVLQESKNGEWIEEEEMKG